ncbi:hypothetical protein M5K25_019496 [Dendrobium thyrsiflorum]|uniref:Uncharacterized protein n=1 Tax=Dendrobium thyrsiflorum TaxID=117978 RepID=A0ABD0ULU8_DENTH
MLLGCLIGFGTQLTVVFEFDEPATQRLLNAAVAITVPRGQSQSLKRLRERSKTALAPLLLLDHRRSSAGPPPKRPYSSPDHHLKALHSAGPPPKGPIVRRTTSRRPYTSPDHRRATSQRPYALPKARRAAQGQTLCSRPDVLLKALRPA